jgi:hypothetical protein
MTTDKSADDNVLDDVFSSERDRGGKSAPPEAAAAEPKVEPQAQPQAEPQPTQETQAQDPETGRMVPLSELLQERKKSKSKLEEESRARIAAEERAKLYEQQLQQFSRPQAQQPQRQQVRIPDPVTDPENYARYVQQSTEQRLIEQSLNFSERMARREHGTKTVDEALQAATQAGLVASGHFLQTAPDDPWAAMVEWHKQQKVLAEVGADPEAYRKKIEDEARAKVLEELKAGNGPAAQGQPQRFPGTLGDATATGKQGAHLTDEAVMSAVFSTDRDRRK